jgi:hypothetical protein
VGSRSAATLSNWKSIFYTRRRLIMASSLSRPGGIEDSNARQRHRLGEHVDDEKFVFHVVLAVVGADNLGLVKGLLH